MKCLLTRPPRLVAIVALVAFSSQAVRPVYAVSPLVLHNWQGQIDLTAPGPLPFTLEGTASHLGEFTARGEVVFVPGEDPGSLEGSGVVVFQAASGDLLVGVVTWDADPESQGTRTSQMHFSWRDSVQFHDGSVFFSTGHFALAKNRPPGLLVVIAIIAILIGLVLPPVQTVK